MSDKTFTIDLARLLVAAAWVDGELSKEEINALKDLLFTIPEISGEEWKHIDFIEAKLTIPRKDREVL